MRLRFEYNSVEDGYPCGHDQIIIKGKNLRSCLLTAFDFLEINDTASDVMDYEREELGRRMTDKELLSRLVHRGDDGDEDTILKISNEDTHETIYETSYHSDVDEIDSYYDDEPAFEEK